jgi:hypothetical protein
LDQAGSTTSVDPLASKVHSIIAHLHMPLWNPNAGTGGPLLADMITAPLDLLKLPVFLSPSAVIWDVYLLGRFLFAGLVTVLFARRLAAKMGNPGRWTRRQVRRVLRTLRP